MISPVYYLLLLGAVLFLLQPKGGTWSYLLNVRWLYVFLLSFSAVQLFVPVSIFIARKFNIMDNPDGVRKIHTYPVPRLGGLAIFLTVNLVVLRNLQFNQQLSAVIVGASLFYLLGLIDDIKPLSATFRFVVQILIVLYLVLNNVIITAVPDVPLRYFWKVLVTIFWFVGIANAINFMDGLDGLAAGLTFISSVLFFLIGWQTRQSYLSYLTIALAGACGGFLIFNWHPAKVFLGDSGATYCGFLLAAIAVMGSWATKRPVQAVATPLLILSIPIFDMIYITVSRIRNGLIKNFRDWLEYTGKDHLHHRLLHLGFGHPIAVLFIYLLSFTLGCGALVIRYLNVGEIFLVLIQATLILSVVVILMLVGRSQTDR